ncbi:extracellular serine-rich protein [Aspergillus sclerotialis]|uniref:Extracellular serine-rich protein n=1 Tax=Aspergillus sclerotialis TaxID=2070753 RepID=A0A3A3AAL7_9EURO|nr:extracellular serine-rich protein [Aspergillus sclerotialis]
MIKVSLCTFALFCLPLVGAQYGGDGGGSSDTTTTTASSTESGSASSTTKSVDVGESGLTFNPDTIHIPAGGVVEFHFYPGDHSVAQAAFDNPCHPISDTGFFSGSMSSAKDGKPVWSLTVNDTNPIWFYCGQVGHCQAGMVGVINPSGSDMLDSFKSAASNANGQSVPSKAQGGILGTSRAGQTTTTSSSMTTTSSRSTATGTQTSIGGSSPSSTNIAENLHVSTDLSVLSILTLTVSMFLM